MPIFSLRLWLVAIPIAFATTIAAQDIVTVRDSIFIERGVAGTTDFTPEARISVTAYDDRGRPLTELRERRTQGGTWAPELRRQFAYAEGELVDQLAQRWDSGTSTWRNQRRDQYQYSNGQLQQRLRQRATADGTLFNDRRWQYTYDAAGRETSELLQQWDGSAWGNFTRKVVDYTPAGLISEQVLQAWIGGAWRNARSRIWQYAPVNDAPRVEQTLARVWSVAAGEWENQIRQRFNYNDSGLWTESQYQAWNATEAKWDNTDRTRYQYDQQRPSGVISQIWTTDWQNEGRVDLEFANNLLRSRIQQWDPDAGEWENFLRYWIEFSEEFLPFRKIGMQIWNAAMSDWENRNFTRRISYSYTDLILNRVAEAELPQACRIPNPYLPGTPFACELPPVATGYQLEVFDMLGRRVLTQRVTDTQSLAIASRPAAGTYVVRISDGRQVRHLQRLVIH